MTSSSQLNVSGPGLHVEASKDGAVFLDLEHDRLLKLNPVGAEMWNLISTGNTESQIIDSIAQNYSVDKQTVATDLHALLGRFSELGVTPNPK